MLLYIVRHGDPDYPTDSLMPRGVLQAEAVAKRLEKVGIDRIFTSPMGRARQTAEPLCRLLNKEYTVEEWAKEITVLTELPEGGRESVARVQNTRFRENDQWKLGAEDALDCTVFNDTDMAECMAYIETEGNAFLEKLGYRYEDGNYRILWPNTEKVALFCHGNFARVWLSCLLKIPVHLMFSGFGYNHTGVTVVSFKCNEDGLTAPRCLAFSDISHLYAHGPDTNYNGTFLL